MSSSELSISNSNHVTSRNPIAKRRKLRKGTFSCWECKRRKTRCEFQPASSPVCVSCKCRKLPCISQEFPEPADNAYEEVERRIIHVEGLVSQFVQQKRTSDNSQDQLSQRSTRTDILSNEEIPMGKLIRSTLNTTFSLSTEANNRRLPLFSLPAAPQDPLSICRSLNSYLHSILSHESIILRILNHGNFFSLSFQVPKESSQATKSCVADTQQLVQISQLPPLTSHPVLFAKRLIQLALCLQKLYENRFEQPRTQLNESLCDSAQRYMDIASCHVTSRDSLMNSMDGLETLMLEARYYITIGELRRAWLIFRRALGIAQLMSLPQLARTKGHHVEFMWFRLIYSERFLSLMLGLPVTVDDNSFASKKLLEAKTPPDRLERIHAMVAGRIISRNLRMQTQQENTQNNVYSYYKETQDIDHELKQATRILPARWWICPTLSYVATNAEVMEKTDRLLTQMHQYYLLVLIHQPYLIRSLLDTSNMEDSRSPHQAIDYTYSELAILSASRDVLSRFLAIRDFHQEKVFRGLDDKAFNVSVALLLTHLNRRRLGRANVFEHQRSQNVGTIQSVIKCMQRLPLVDKDDISSRIIHILRKLVDIEADAADGVNYIVRCGQDSIFQGEHCTENESLQLSVPYFGTICLVRKGSNNTWLSNLDPDITQMSDAFPDMLTAYDISNVGEFNMESVSTADTYANTDIFASSF